MIQYYSALKEETRFYGRDEYRLKFAPQTQVQFSGYYAKDTVFGGLTLVQNELVSSKNDLLKKYNSYENESGIGLKGKDITFFNLMELSRENIPPYRANQYSYESSTPVFVGDYYNSESVIYASGGYDETMQLWRGTVLLGILPQQVIEPTENLHTTKLNETLDNIISLVKQIHSDLLIPVVSGNPVITPPGYIVKLNQLEKNSEDLKELGYENA